MTQRKVEVIGGGTRFHLDSHLFLGSPARGGTAERLVKLCEEQLDPANWVVRLTLTTTADPTSRVDTNAHVSAWLDKVLADPATAAIIMNAAIVDFDASFVADDLPSGTSDGRLRTRDDAGQPRSYLLRLTPAEKLIGVIKQRRPDITLVGFKQTSGADQEGQEHEGRALLQRTGADVVLANERVSRRNLILDRTGVRANTLDRGEALRELAQITCRCLTHQ